MEINTIVCISEKAERRSGKIPLRDIKKSLRPKLDTQKYFMTEPLKTPADAASDEEATEAMRRKVEGSNIDPTTLLATDYLNHFNEIVMLLEMIADMPEILDDVKAWKPKGYKDHFRDSTIAEKDLAIEAYDFVPVGFREPFEQTIEQINAMIPSTVERLEKNLVDGEMEVLKVNAQTLSRLIQRLMDTASAIIHGSHKTMDQSEIDVLLG